MAEIDVKTELEESRGWSYLVEVRRDAQRRLYRLRPEPLRPLTEWLEPYRSELAGRLDSLERHLGRTARPINPKERPR